MMHVTDQLQTLGETLRRIGARALKPGIWSLPGGCVVRTGYVMRELTFWIEGERGNVIPGMYYRGDDLLSFLVSDPENIVLKNLGDCFAETLDSRVGTP